VEICKNVIIKYPTTSYWREQLDHYGWTERPTEPGRPDTPWFNMRDIQKDESNTA